VAGVAGGGSDVQRTGDVFVLDMGEPVKIADLAADLIRLSGKEVGTDIEIRFTGIRPGEKLSEALWDEGMSLEPTEHPDILRVQEDLLLEGEPLETTVDELVRLAREGDVRAIVGLLSDRIPASLIRQTPPPDFTSVI